MKPDQRRLNAQFLVHMIYAGPPQMAIDLATQGSTVGHFNIPDIGALTIHLPPRGEQDEIVVSITEQTAGLERTIARLESEIDLLREYRARLVADVVAGKLDVRAAAAKIYDEAPLGTADDVAEVGDERELADEEAEA